VYSGLNNYTPVSGESSGDSEVANNIPFQSRQSPSLRRACRSRARISRTDTRTAGRQNKNKQHYYNNNNRVMS